MSVVAELVSRRYLVYQLAAREIKARYKQSFLGIGWAVIQPLALMAIFSLIFTRFIRVEVKDYPYPIFCYAGLLIWGLFERSLRLLTDSIVSHASLIQKVYFPRQAFLLAGLGCRLVDFAVAFVVYLGLMAVFAVRPTVHFLWALPIIAIVCALAFGVCLFSSALQVFRRDVSSVMALVAQVWFYATPIVYPLEKVPEQWRWVSILNPMTGAVEGFKDAVLRGRMPDLRLLAVSALAATLLVVLGHAFFTRAERHFADVI